MSVVNKILSIYKLPRNKVKIYSYYIYMYILRIFFEFFIDRIELFFFINKFIVGRKQGTSDRIELRILEQAKKT